MLLLFLFGLGLNAPPPLDPATQEWHCYKHMLRAIERQLHTHPDQVFNFGVPAPKGCPSAHAPGAAPYYLRGNQVSI